MEKHENLGQDNAPLSPDQLQRYIKAAQVFTPSAPINSQKLFAGRIDQVSQVVSAVSQQGQHVILYGERGVGKTSLATVISQIMQGFSDESVETATINCDVREDFVSLWEKIIRELNFLKQNFNLSEEEITPELIRQKLQQSPSKIIIVIDELDRINGSENISPHMVSVNELTDLLADTIKTLSDHLVRTTLIIVGVADSVDELIRGHGSIERSLVQVQMPRMSRNELHEIIDSRLRLLDMEIDESVKERIAFLSQGLPSFTHLLALNASQRAIQRNSKHIGEEDLAFAIHQAVEKAYQSIVSAHHKATSSPRSEAIFAQVLLACALSPKDDLGFFTARNVEAPMSAIMQKRYRTNGFSKHLHSFCEENKGPVLQKVGSPRSFRFRFVNPMMQPYTIMHGLSHQIISTEDLIKLSGTA